MNKILFVIFILLLISGCDFSAVTETYNPDYTPEISVFSVISTDESDEFVIVERTYRLNEDYDINSLITIIDDAEVYIICGEDTVQFTFYRRPQSNYWDSDYLAKGMYLDLNNKFCAKAGKTYQLVVKVPDGRTITSSTTVPAIPTISQPAPWTLLQKETIKNTSIQWENSLSATGYVVYFYIENSNSKEKINILHDHFIYESPTTLSDLDNYLLVNNVIPLSNIATIKIFALDQNSYDYVSKSGLASWIGTDLKIVQGGIGAFGSFSSDSVKVRWE